MTIAAHRRDFDHCEASGNVPGIPLTAGELNPYLLVEAMPACLIDRSGHCVLLNETMADVVGRPVDDIKGRPIATFFPSSEAVLARWFALADTGRLLPDRQFTWHGRYYQLTARLVRGAKPALDALSITVSDVTRYVRLERRLRASRRRLAALVHYDDLTGLLNRRGLEVQLHRELRRARRDQRPLSLLMIDIDRFKAYNDGWGHLQGDSCLQAVSKVLQRSMRRSGDLAGRFGGEEFVVVLPDVPQGGAEVVAERLRQGVESLWLHHPAADARTVTISVGAATLLVPQNGLPIDTCRIALLQAADAALYRAKAAGRNRVESCALDSHGK